MIDIAKKKMPSVLVYVILYLSYCAAAWYFSRGSIAYFGEQYGLGAWFANDIWAFFLGGLLSVLILEMFVQMFMSSVRNRVKGDFASIRYVLYLSIIVSNLVIFGLNFIYLAVPLYASVIDIFVNDFVTILFVSLGLFYCFKREYVEKSFFPFVLSRVLGMFLIVYGTLTGIRLIMAVSV